MNFQELKELMNKIFLDIVEVITQISEINEKQVKEIVSSYRSIDESLEVFLKSVENEFKKIKDTLFAKRSDVNINKLKEDIETATNRFMEIADDLEILSLNTICKTKKLGKEKAVISHISDEIKKNSDHAKFILSKIKNNFYSIYEIFSHIVSSFEELKHVKLYESSDELQSIHNVEIAANISELLQYSQFHDIFRQQLEKIEETYLSINWQSSSLFEYGKRVKFLEQGLELLKEMKADIKSVLKDIIKGIKKFLYDLNTDIQNLFSKVGIISYSFEAMDKVEQELFKDIEKLKEEVRGLKSHLKTSFDLVEELVKFKKNFYNLRVIAHIEVNRFGVTDLFSLTDSMDTTYSNLLDLVDKILTTIEVWQGLAKEMEEIVLTSYNSMLGYHSSNIKTGFNAVKNKNQSIDSDLQSLKDFISKRDFVNQLERYKEKLIENLNGMIELFEKELKEINFALHKDDVNKEEFKEGYKSIDIEVIDSTESEEPAIELF